MKTKNILIILATCASAVASDSRDKMLFVLMDFSSVTRTSQGLFYVDVEKGETKGPQGSIIISGKNNKASLIDTNMTYVQTYDAILKISPIVIASTNIKNGTEELKQHTKGVVHTVCPEKKEWMYKIDSPIPLIPSPALRTPPATINFPPHHDEIMAEIPEDILGEMLKTPGDSSDEESDTDSIPWVAEHDEETAV
jgi:hypothetical protein